MNVTLDEFLLNVRWADGLDILVFAVALYLVWQWLQRRMTHSAALALAGIVLLYVVSKALHMYLTVAAFQAGLTVMLFALVVIFQDDLRQAVERISTWQVFARRTSVPHTESFTHNLIEAVTLLAKERLGALIVLPGRQSLERHTRGGVPVDAVLSLELLHSIFHPESRGHDGAVVVRNERVERLGVHLPLSSNLEMVGARGTRHAAALGLAERTDALVIVVSEERGTIALASEGTLVEVPTAAKLEGRLLAYAARESGNVDRPPTHGERLRKLAALTGSLIIASILWFVFAFRVETIQRTIEQVPVEFRNLPEEWVLEEDGPTTVRLTLVGPERAFDTWDAGDLKVSIDLRNISDDQTQTPVDEDDLNLPADIHLQESDPPLLGFQLYHTTTVLLPVRADTEGSPPHGVKLDAVISRPDALTVRVPTRQCDLYDHLTTTPIKLGDVRESKSVQAQVQFPRGVQPVRPDEAEVEVQIKVSRVRPPGESDE